MTTLPQTHLPDHLSVLGGKCRLLFTDIVFLEAQGSYTIFRCRNGMQVMTSKALSWYKDTLPDYLIRVHKSYFVNLAFVVAFEGETIRLADGQRITVSRRRRRAVRKSVKAQLNPLSCI
jgi:DNA-binding LytR/AlgR family response regulator